MPFPLLSRCAHSSERCTTGIPRRLGRGPFRIVGENGRRYDDHFRPVEMFLLVPDVDGRPELTQGTDSVRFCDIRTRDTQSLLEQHLGDGAHACAANSNEMNVLRNLQTWTASLPPAIVGTALAMLAVFPSFGQEDFCHSFGQILGC